MTQQVHSSTHLAFVVIVALLSACHSDPIEAVALAPAGVDGKPLLRTVSGLAVANELVVRFVASVDADEVDAVAASHAASVVWRGPRTGYYVLRFLDRSSCLQAAKSLAAAGQVADVQPQRVAQGAGIGTSPDELRALQWNLRALSIDPAAPIAPISGVRIAVLDTGVAYESHHDVRGDYALAPALSEVSFEPGYDFVNGGVHANDDQGHGTHVVGIIAGSSGATALARGAHIIPVKILDAGNLGTELSLAEGIYFAVDAGADVINMSLAFSPEFFPSSYLQRAVTYAADRGVVMVAAAGNHGADVVAYPAAFRDVIAVGASRMAPSARRWSRAGAGLKNRGGGSAGTAALVDSEPQRRLRTAAYSNRGALVDVVAPGGDIDRDADRDGNVDGIVAMTFVGDPTAFDYYLYAGTSQAAAEVSAIAARMLHHNPTLTPDDLRSVLSETAATRGRGARRNALGLGHLVAPDAVAAAADDQQALTRRRFFASIAVTLHERRGGGRYARARVEIVDVEGTPARNVTVHGSFTGAAYGARKGRTRNDGTITFTSSSLGASGYVSGFQVEAVVSKYRGQHLVDRPRSFYRIDSCSLASLVNFAEAAGIGTSPGPVPPGSVLGNPITVVMPHSARGQIDTLGLLNFSWGIATAPMAVAVDADWFGQQFPGAAPLRVVIGGDGIGTSPIVIDPATAFASPMPGAGDACLDLQVRTLRGTGIGTSPVIPDPKGRTCNGQCDRYRAALARMWTNYYGGSGPAAVSDGSLPRDMFDHLSSTMQGYVGFGRMGDSSPVRRYGDTLDAAGIGVTPAVPTGAASGYGAASITN